MATKNKTNMSATMKFLERVAGGPLTLSMLLKSIRLGEEMSLGEFADKLRITPSHLCDIEKGRKTVSPERAARFAKILGRFESEFVRLALQDIVYEAGLKYRVCLGDTCGAGRRNEARESL